MEQIEKTELHMHLGGSWPLSFLERHATTEEIKNLNDFLDAMELKGADMNYHACFGAFALASKIVNNNAKVEEGVIALCQQLWDDGVTYVEIRTSLKDYGEFPGNPAAGWEAYVQSVLRGACEGCQRAEREGRSTSDGSPRRLHVAVILSLKRNSSKEMVRETVRLIKKYRHDSVGGSPVANPVHVVGLDISDDALLGDIRVTLDEVIDEVRSAKIPIALHVGECSEETEEQQMAELEFLNPTRVGHAVFLHPRAREWVESRRIPVEMCPSSSVVAHMVEDYAQHPYLQKMRADFHRRRDAAAAAGASEESGDVNNNGSGSTDPSAAAQPYPVAICTDDPLVFRTTWSRESEIVMQHLGCSLQDIQEVHRAALQFRFQ